MSRELIHGPHGLKSTVCECSRTKREMQSFCGRCYRSLPPDLRKALYRRMGEGYEEAYQAARQLLRGDSEGYEEGKRKARQRVIFNKLSDALNPEKP